MKKYLYEWHLQPRDALRMSVEVAVLSAPDARRTIDRYLEGHNGGGWPVESVSRKRRLSGIEDASDEPRTRDAFSPSLRNRESLSLSDGIRH